MSADGYFRVPRKLSVAPISVERKWALVWMIAQASYTEREECGIALRVGETPIISLSRFEKEFGWSRKAARLFVEYATSSKCSSDTGIRIRVGQLAKGHTQGHREGHTQGHTYLIGLVRDTVGDGHTQGHREGHTQGHTYNKDIETGSKTGKKEKTNMAHRVSRVSHGYPLEFDSVWMILPKREGSNPKMAAYQSWRARVRERVPVEYLAEKAAAYAAFCDATNLTGTRHAMQGGTFFGPNRPYDQEWEIPTANGSVKPVATGLVAVAEEAVAAAIIARMNG